MIKSRVVNAGPKRYLRCMALSVILVAGITACSRSPDSTKVQNTGGTEVVEQDEQGGAELTVLNAYMPAPVPGRQMGVIYLELTNPSRRDRELILLETAVAETAEVHRSVYEDGTMRMRKIQHLSVPAGQSIQFEPGGYHIMLMQTDGIPEPPDSFGLRMIFDGGEAIEVDVQVRARQ